MPEDILKQRRFQKPKGFTFKTFERAGRNIRYGMISPDAPKATIVMLPGLGEYAEKYFETARNCVEQGYAFTVIDWFGQGGSGRYLDNPLKRHGDDFIEDVSDLHTLITEHIGNIKQPLIMLGHSMGGNIGLRYLIEHPSIFSKAFFTAPMCGIEDISYLPRGIQSGLSSILNKTVGERFTSGHGNSALQQRNIFDGNILSGDPDRFALHSAWFDKKEELRIGDVTYGWVYHAIRSCMVVQDKAHTIETPSLFILAGQEKIVDNKTALGIVSAMQCASQTTYEHAHHEILMESDHIRNDVLGRLWRFIKSDAQNPCMD